MRQLINDYIFYKENQPTTEQPPPVASCDSTGLYSDPKDCASYYMCRNGALVHMRCVAHMMFDPSNGECGYIDPSRCRPGQSIHIPNVFKEVSNLPVVASAELKDNKPKVIAYTERNTGVLCFS